MLRDRNVITAWLGEHSAREARQLFAKARIATYESPDRRSAVSCTGYIIGAIKSC